MDACLPCVRGGRSVGRPPDGTTKLTQTPPPPPLLASRTQGAIVVLGVRNEERGAAARADIVASLVEEGGHGSAAQVGKRVLVLKGDLQDLDDVARCARAFWWVDQVEGKTG